MQLDSEILEILRRPFPREALSIKPGALTADRTAALVLVYIDARAVMDRLDEAAPGDWSFDWEPAVQYGETLALKGMLTVCGVTRCDAGEARHEDEPYKAAVSDALKRCAVQFGIGRSLYDLPRIFAAVEAHGNSFRFEGERRLLSTLAEMMDARSAGDYPRARAALENIRSGSYIGQPSGGDRSSSKSPRSRSGAVSQVQAERIVRLCQGRFGESVQAKARFLEQQIGRVCEPLEFTEDEYAIVLKALRTMPGAVPDRKERGEWNG